MKILHTSESVKGGVATVMRSLLIDQSVAYGADNVFCLVPSSQRDELVNVADEQVFLFKRTGRNIVSFFRFQKNLLKLCLREKPDIVHLHSSYAGFLGRAVLILLWPVFRPKIIYCPHAWSFLMEGSAFKKKTYALIEWLLALFTDKIVCVSQFEKDEGLRYLLPENKMAVIYNGVPMPERNAVRLDKFAVSEKDVTNLLFIGRFDYQKGFDILLDAMSMLEGKPFQLTAVGSGVHENVVPPWRSNINYAGWVAPDKVAEFYHKNDILLMPSRWEGFAMVPIEAMSYGLPVIASDCCSLPEVVLDGKTGLLFPKEDAARMVELLQSTAAARWEEMGQAARVHCQENFTLEKMCVSTRQLYEASCK